MLFFGLIPGCRRALFPLFLEGSLRNKACSHLGSTRGGAVLQTPSFSCLIVSPAPVFGMTPVTQLSERWGFCFCLVRLVTLGSFLKGSWKDPTLFRHV